MMHHKINQILVLTGIFIWLTILSVQAEVLSLSHESGKLQDSLCVKLSVDTAAVDPVYGAVFSLNYDPSIVLSRIESHYFDTFDAQLAKAYGSAYTDNLSAYGQSFVYETDINAGITLVAAARCAATQLTSVLFEFYFDLKDGATADSYPIYLKPVPRTFADHSIDDTAQPHPILTGLDSSYPYTSNLAYPVLLDGQTDSSGHALQTRHGMLTFSIADEVDPPPKIDTVVGQITSSVLGKTEGIAGASVKLLETGQTVKSDADGFYTFTNVPEGTYTVEAGTSFLDKKQFQTILTQANAVISSFQLNQWNMDGFFSFSDVQNAVSEAVAEQIDIISKMFTLNELNEAVEEAVSEKEELISRMHLDVDCNGQADALTDGLMIMRYLFGITKGESLLENAVDNVNGTCTSEEEVIANIQRILPGLNARK
ncbi:secreted protein containing Collagen-binding surface protein Cna-like, B region domain protein [Candidatus Magnetomorum sp. HK-1]|nr:secreted protein containing Collagen-binding surface protein Cna-like, B region domain protein [Candidatus Magnetomorum sp. HK-1]